MASRERGFAFLPFLLGNWQLIGYGIAIMAVVGYIWSCESKHDDYDNLVATLKAEAKLSIRVSEIQIANANKRKETADESYKRNVARLQRDIKRLRDNPPSSFLPAPAPGSSSPERATLDRAEFDAALRDYRTEVIGLLEEGDTGIAGLDSAKMWAQ